MAGEKERVTAYQNTIARLEPEIAAIDAAAFYASAAISLKRLADNSDRIVTALESIEASLRSLDDAGIEVIQR